MTPSLSMGCCLCSPLPCPAPPQQSRTPASASAWRDGAAPPCPLCPAPGSLQPGQEKGGQGSIGAASAQTCPGCRHRWLPHSHLDRSPKGAARAPRTYLGLQQPEQRQTLVRDVPVGANLRGHGGRSGEPPRQRPPRRPVLTFHWRMLRGRTAQGPTTKSPLMVKPRVL